MSARASGSGPARHAAAKASERIFAWPAYGVLLLTRIIPPDLIRRQDTRQDNLTHATDSLQWTAEMELAYPPKAERAALAAERRTEKPLQGAAA